MSDGYYGGGYPPQQGYQQQYGAPAPNYGGPPPYQSQGGHEQYGAPPQQHGYGGQEPYGGYPAQVNASLVNPQNTLITSLLPNFNPSASSNTQELTY